MSTRSGSRGQTVALTFVVALAGIAVIAGMIGLAWVIMGA